MGNKQSSSKSFNVNKNKPVKKWNTDGGIIKAENVQQQYSPSFYSTPPAARSTAGMQKAKQYDWKDSNLALFGSDTEKQVKKESAEQEPAWKNAGKEVGLQIWRIVKFKVTHWPKEDYGKFYDGDSYIVLNTYKEEGSNALLYDVHFWIGKYSTQDEYGTAAYKTVELDTLLDDIPIQHREVQDHESEMFRSYFKTIEILSGGAETGFRHVEQKEYKTRLLHFHGDRHGVKVSEIKKSKELLDHSDLYILDLGNTLIQWNGSGANKDEKHKASQYMGQISDERSGKVTKEVVDDGQDDEEFLGHLTESKEEEVNFEAADHTKELFRLSNESGKMLFSKEKSGNITKSDFDSKDVFILDTKKELFVWIGDRASREEKKNAMAHAHNYLQKTDHPLLSISCIKENCNKKTERNFTSALAA